ncbi:ATP-binding cassette domain-containing protein, partial [bacterium]|nr:ATP-binding cassette domain-containing protein [bacterium]
MLTIRDLKVSVDDHVILRGIDLQVNANEVHAIMGPNGSGKSTLANVLAGREEYEVTAGEVVYEGQDLLDLSPEDRAREGIFMAFQYPVEIPGVSMSNFLKTALNELRESREQEPLDAMEFFSLIRDKLKLVKMDEKFLSRSINEGFS